MTDKHLVTLQIPDDLYQQIQRLADQQAQSIETALLETVNLLLGSSTGDVDQQLARLQSFSDEQLWSVVYLRLTDLESLRLSELLDRGNQGRLTTQEKAELDMLVGKVNRQMLLRSEALVLLKARGHDIEQYRQH